jgi:hypothetical protein
LAQSNIKLGLSTLGSKESE